MPWHPELNRFLSLVRALQNCPIYILGFLASGNDLANLDCVKTLKFADKRLNSLPIKCALQLINTYGYFTSYRKHYIKESPCNISFCSYYPGEFISEFLWFEHPEGDPFAGAWTQHVIENDTADTFRYCQKCIDYVLLNAISSSETWYENWSFLK